MTELDNTEHLEMLEDINFSGKRLLKTLDTILTFSELTSSDVSYKITQLNISEFLKIFFRENSHRIEGKNLQVKLNLHNDQILAMANETLLEKSLDQIFDNSLKYTREGFINISALPNDDKNWILIKVQDTGIGISEANIPKIFEAFRQSSEGPSRNYEGCGLGLTLTKKMLEVMKGKISVTSKLSEGSEFIIWLPVFSAN